MYSFFLIIISYFFLIFWIFSSVFSSLVLLLDVLFVDVSSVSPLEDQLSSWDCILIKKKDILQR